MRSRFDIENSPHVDQVVRDYTESNPSIHSILATIATPIQSVSSFQNTDSSFTAGSPLLSFPKPARLLSLPTLEVFCGAIGD
jgi:hypothetical protein